MTQPPPPPGSSTSNGLRIELRFFYFPCAASLWRLRDHHCWPICLHFAPELLNTVGEPLYGWHRAARRHKVGGNGHFHYNRNTIATIIPCSHPLFLILSLSLFCLQWDFLMIKVPLSSICPHQTRQPATQELPGLIECIPSCR